jgi:hypothetical protein
MTQRYRTPETTTLGEGEGRGFFSHARGVGLGVVLRAAVVRVVRFVVLAPRSICLGVCGADVRSVFLLFLHTRGGVLWLVMAWTEHRCSDCVECHCVWCLYVLYVRRRASLVWSV